RYGNGRSLSLSSPFRSLSFNPAEAFNFDLTAEWQKKYTGQKSMGISPLLHYSTGRNRISPALRLQFEDTNHRFTLEGGDRISQFNAQDPIHPLVNSAYYLFFNQNHIRLYQKQFFRAEYRQRHIFEIIDLTADLETGRRKWLDNLDKRGKLLWGDPGK